MTQFLTKIQENEAVVNRIKKSPVVNAQFLARVMVEEVRFDFYNLPHTAQLEVLAWANSIKADILLAVAQNEHIINELREEGDTEHDAIRNTILRHVGLDVYTDIPYTKFLELVAWAKELVHNSKYGVTLEVNNGIFHFVGEYDFTDMLDEDGDLIATIRYPLQEIDRRLLYEFARIHADSYEMGKVVGANMKQHEIRMSLGLRV